jgi:hypothetical protein
VHWGFSSPLSFGEGRGEAVAVLQNGFVAKQRGLAKLPSPFVTKHACLGIILWGELHS